MYLSIIKIGVFQMCCSGKPDESITYCLKKTLRILMDGRLNPGM